MSVKPTQSLALFERAARVVPGGIYGHASPSLAIPGVFPYYARQARGCRYWDVDGREYIDFMCGYGPILLGYQHPEVEEAAERQRKDGDCFNHPAAVMVDLAEYLVAKVDFADWTVFGKNGSDMATWSIQVAREHTHRRKILAVEQSYHGSDPWCTPGRGGLLEEDQAHIHRFPWNDLNRFHEGMKRHRGDVAAVIMTPFHHPVFGDCVLPSDGFFKEIQSACRRDGVVFILDDIRAGFRLNHGGSHRYFGFEPDMICFSKALANGHPLSAALGRDSLKKAAGKVFLTGSFWNNAVPMAAALACLQILERDKGIARMQKMGEQLRQGLIERSRKRGLSIRCSGPPAIPFMTFANESNFYRNQTFCAEAARRGALFHPHHNWFLSTAHEEKDLQQALDIADAAFAAVAQEFGG